MLHPWPRDPVFAIGRTRPAGRPDAGIFAVSMTRQIIVADDHPLFREALKAAVGRLETDTRFVEADSVMARCGPGTPIGFGENSISGESTPPGGAIVPPTTPITPPPPDPEASDS